MCFKLYKTYKTLGRNQKSEMIFLMYKWFNAWYSYLKKFVVITKEWILKKIWI